MHLLFNDSSANFTQVPTLNRAEMNAKLQAVMPSEQQRSYMNMGHLKTLGGILNVLVIVKRFFALA